jgi:hypothetical protein
MKTTKLTVFAKLFIVLLVMGGVFGIYKIAQSTGLWFC